MSPQHQAAVEGAPGQAPVRPDTLRQMLFEAKSRADTAQEKLVKSERLRADLANKLATNAETLQLLTSLRELALDHGEGVLLYVRRPDEPHPYPIVVGKGELARVDPSKWWSDIIDPRARAVLDAADRAKSWIPADPAADQRMREDYNATREVLDVPEGELICEKADQIETVNRAALKELHDLRVSVGQYKNHAAERELRVAELQKEIKKLEGNIEVLELPGEDEMEDNLVGEILAKHGTVKPKAAPAEGEEMAAASGPSYAGIALENIARLDTEGTPLEDPLAGTGGGRKGRVADKRNARKLAAKPKPKKAKPKAVTKAPAKLKAVVPVRQAEPPDTEIPDVPPDGLGADEPGDNLDGGNLERGAVRPGTMDMPTDGNASRPRR